MNRVLFFYHSHIKKYGMNDESSSGFLSCIMDWVISFVTGYNHNKYWFCLKIKNMRGNRSNQGNQNIRDIRLFWIFRLIRIFRIFRR